MYPMAKALLSECFGQSEVLREQKRISQEIEDEIRKDKLRSTKSLKLLLLGTAESGKSTFVKQMRIIHGHRYSEKEKTQYGIIILRNLISAIQSLIEAMNILQIPFIDASSDDNAKIIHAIDLNEVTIPKKYFMNAIKELWNDR